MRTARRLLGTAAAAAALAAGEARAQSCGGCVAPPTPAGGAQRSWLAEGDWTARLSAEYEVKDRTFRGHRRVVNDFDETLRVRRLNLALRHGLDDDWTAGLDLSDPEFTYRLRPPGGRRTTVTVRGPGDTVLRLGRRFEPFGGEPPADGLRAGRTGEDARGHDRRAIDVPTLAVWGGVSLPTGDVKKPDPSIVTRDFSVSNLQTGTGTFDPLAQVRVDLPFAEWRLFAEATAIVPLAENRHDYRTGSTLSASVGAERELAPGLRASVTATFQRVGNDEFRGDDVGVGGGKWVYVTPALSWDLSERATLDVGVRLTALRDADTKVVDSGAAFQAGLTFRF